jgi:hypothetical protein
MRTTEPEQLLSATVPAKFTPLGAGLVSPDTVSAADVTTSETADVTAPVSATLPTPVGAASAAVAGAAPAPAIARAQNAAARGFLMGGPLLRRRRPEIFRPPALLSCAL